MIKSKRNLYATVLLLLAFGGIFGFIGTLSIVKLLEDLKDGYTSIMFIVPLLFYPWVIYIFYYLFIYIPSFTLDNDGITVSTIFKIKKYRWAEIDKMELTGKQPHKFAFASTPLEATTIYLFDNSKIYLWSTYYRNKSDLRVIINRANNILQSNKDFAKLDFSVTKRYFKEQSTTEDDGDVYNDSHFFTFNGVFFYGWYICIGYMVFTHTHVLNYGAIISISWATLVVSGIMSYQMHYFTITSKFLIVKNSIWFWRKDVYLLSDIREVVFEIPYNYSTSLRIITNDFQEKLYPAGNLKNKTWKKVMECLLGEKIKVRNEANI